MHSLYLVIYFILIYVLSRFVSKANTKEGFLVGNRQIGTIPMALSISATWIWAPALFVSAEQAFVNGWVGLMYFVVPNVLCLIIFIPFAKRLRKCMPRGYTLSEFMHKTYSNRVKGIYLFQLSSLSLLSTVVQIVAGGKVITIVTGIPFWLTSILLGLFAYAYSRRNGIRTSVFTDVVQMMIIFTALIILVPWVFNATSSSVETIKIGINGINNITLFNERGIELLLTFGIPTTIGLIAGPFGDQNFWQRSLSVKEKSIGKSFVLGALIFSTVPLLMSGFGFIASGIGFNVNDRSVVNLELVSATLPEWTSLFFIFLILGGLLSTMNSNLASMSSLANDMKPNATIRDLRLSMLILVLIAILLSNIPASIVDFFLFYGTLRATTFMPTVLTLLNVKLHEKGVFYGIITSLVVGFPIFIYGKLASNTLLTVVGSLSALLLSGIVALILTSIERRKNA